MGHETCQILGQVSHNLLYWMKKSLDGYMWSGERLTRKQQTSRPDHSWPETLEVSGKARQAEGKAQSGRMKSSFFITHENCEGSISSTRRIRNSKRTIKNARQKLEASVAPATPCKIMKKYCGSGASSKIETQFACILEACESTRTAYGRNIAKSS